jgi:hypothetical protein
VLLSITVGVSFDGFLTGIAFMFSVMDFSLQQNSMPAVKTGDAFTRR